MDVAGIMRMPVLCVSVPYTRYQIIIDEESVVMATTLYQYGSLQNART